MPKKIQRELPVIHLIDEKTIGERIAETRKEKGLSQLELSNKIGINRRLLSDYETGRSRIYDEMIVRIALVLEVSTDVLHGIEKPYDKHENIPLRFTKRIKKIEKLPEHKIKNILRTLDDMIKANEE